MHALLMLRDDTQTCTNGASSAAVDGADVAAALSTGARVGVVLRAARVDRDYMSERVQKMARINVDPHAWAELRVRALRKNASLADVLGDWIKKEVRAAEHTPYERPANRATPEPQPIAAATAPAHPRRDSSPTSDVEYWDSLVPPWEE